MWGVMGCANVTDGGVGGGWAGTRCGPWTGDDNMTGGGGDGVRGGVERIGGWGNCNVLISFSASLSQYGSSQSPKSSSSG